VRETSLHDNQFSSRKVCAQRTLRLQCIANFRISYIFLPSKPHEALHRSRRRRLFHRVHLLADKCHGFRGALGLSNNSPATNSPTKAPVQGMRSLTAAPRIHKDQTVLTSFLIATLNNARPTILPEICNSLVFGGTTEGPLCEPSALNTARRSPDLSTFVQLIELASLEDVFLCAGPFTLLAPSNDACDALDPAVVQELLLPENLEKLQEL